MFCQQCGLKLPEGAKFCSVCGTPVAQSQRNNMNSNQNIAQWQTAFTQGNMMPPGASQRPSKGKKVTFFVVGGVLAVLFVVLLSFVLRNLFGANSELSEAKRVIGKAADEAYDGASVKSVEEITKDTYKGTVAVDFSCEYYQYSGTILIHATKTDDIWDTRIVENNVSYTLAPNDNNYYIIPVYYGNREYIISFKEITNSYVTVHYYEHDLDMYGNDIYDADEESHYIEYNPKTKAFEFEFAGYWRITQKGLEYLRYEINRFDDERSKIKEPVDPEDYWWYSYAQSQT